MNCLQDPTLGFSTHDSSSTSLMARHGLLGHKTSLIIDDAALTAVRSAFLMGEFESLYLRVKEVDDGGQLLLIHEARMTTLKCSMTEEMMELSLPKLEMMELLIPRPKMIELSLPNPVVIMMS
ncbi:hypothetical protein Adt_21129 [Abeliophyllum distichum]|uniref:Uncharacterized protein n=1 Tax=Abeliophyllum distichum TaxID=126358 RepID=A0ABD1SYM6_9LAMI